MWKFIRGLFVPQPPLRAIPAAQIEPRVIRSEREVTNHDGGFSQFSDETNGANQHSKLLGEAELLDLMEERGFLTSADIDPEGSPRTADYVEAERLAKGGNTKAALEILEQLCSHPNIYKGHYRLLFQLHRQANKDDLKAGNPEVVRDRVLSMIRMDDEMIGMMLGYWSEIQRRKLGPHYFDADRNLKVTDAKALLAAAEVMKDRKSASQAKKLIERFERIRDKARAVKAKAKA